LRTPPLEGFFAWAVRCGQLAQDDDRLPVIIAALQIVAFPPDSLPASYLFLCGPKSMAG
jgi:hypothetical protein